MLINKMIRNEPSVTSACQPLSTDVAFNAAALRTVVTKLPATAFNIDTYDTDTLLFICAVSFADNRRPCSCTSESREQTHCTSVAENDTTRHELSAAETDEPNIAAQVGCEETAGHSTSTVANVPLHCTDTGYVEGQETTCVERSPCSQITVWLDAKVSLESENGASACLDIFKVATQVSGDEGEHGREEISSERGSERKSSFSYKSEAVETTDTLRLSDEDEEEEESSPSENAQEDKDTDWLCTPNSCSETVLRRDIV